MTEGEFLHFSEKHRHKQAADILRYFHEARDEATLAIYRRIESWCNLPRFDEGNFQALANRYHFHVSKADISSKEHNLLLSPYQKKDKPSSSAFLPVAIYLDNLRSGQNIGSILRTTEAFRLGAVYFSEQTPFIDNQKVQKTSMETFDKVICEKRDLKDLPRPLIALETAPEAPSIFDFTFPKEFTLILGNEEYGVSDETLNYVDAIVKIPLYGFKNSLNVASAFAIAAGVISHQLRLKI
jgi:tRNA G18 (ribose-2'-O)-methylase SpoU